MGYRSITRNLFLILKKRGLTLVGLLLGVITCLYVIVNYMNSPVLERDRKMFQAVTKSGDLGVTRFASAPEHPLPRPSLHDAQSFLKWQADLRQTLIRDVYKVTDIELPRDVSVNLLDSVKIDETVIRKFVYFESFDGTKIPGYLFIPQTPSVKAAILILPGHVNDNESGLAQMSGMVDSYQNGAALHLAKAGFVTFTMELRGFGLLGPQVDEIEHRQIAYNAILGGSFYKSILVKDMKYAVEMLRGIPGVDFKQIGITGVSYGGELAITYGGLDRRIKAVLFQAYGGKIGKKLGLSNVETGQPHYCHIVPFINKYYRHEDEFWLIAPRPLLGIRGIRDAGRSQAFVDEIGKVYTTVNARNSFNFLVLDGGHEFFIEPAIKFFKKHLSLPGSPL